MSDTECSVSAMTLIQFCSVCLQYTIHVLKESAVKNQIDEDNHSVCPFPGSESGMDTLHSFDPNAGRWERVLPENCTSPPSRSGFGMAATRNGSSWTFWLFGGMLDSADRYGQCRHCLTFVTGANLRDPKLRCVKIGLFTN